MAVCEQVEDPKLAKGVVKREVVRVVTPGLVIDGENLCVLSRSGDSRAHSAHDGNLITFHTVKDFRKLVY